MPLSKYEYFINLYELYNIYNSCIKLDIINMTATNSTQELIECVKNYPALYDRKNQTHNNAKEKEAIWLKLSAEFNCDAKKKWNTLRDKYVREKKKERVSGMKYISNWDYFKSMNFLENHIKPRRQLENEEIYEHENENFDENEEIDVKEFYNDFCKEMAASEDIESLNTTNNFNDIIKKLKDSEFNSSNSNLNSIQKSILKTLEIFREKLQNINSFEENNEDEIFLELVANKMKKMSSVEKSNYQMEILRDADEFLLS